MLFRYRKYLHEAMANNVDLDKHPMDGIDVLRACVWLGRAFNSLRNSKTIIRCFEKAGFVMRDEVLESDCEASVMAVPEGELELLAVEAEEAIPPPMDNFEGVLEAMVVAADCKDVELVDMEDIMKDLFSESEEEKFIIKPRQAADHLCELRDFFLSEGMESDYNWAEKKLREVTLMCQERQKQTLITGANND